MRFLYDVLYLVEHLSSLQLKYFQMSPSSPQTAHPEIEGDSAPPPTAARGSADVSTEPPPPLQLDLPIDFQVRHAGHPAVPAVLRLHVALASGR